MTAVKWAIFLAAVFASQPAARWLRGRPALRAHLWTLVGLLPLLAQEPMSLIFFGTTPSDTAGIEVGLIDWLALVLLQVAPPPRRPLPYRLALSVYFLVALVSVTQARWTLVAVGYLWKLGRMYLMLYAIWRAGCDDRRVPAALLRGMTLGVVYAGGLAAWQHFALGIPQATGTFGHQNTFGVVTNLVIMASIARVIAGPAPPLTNAGVVAAVLACLFTASRGALMFLGLGSALIFCLSARKAFTRRKAWIAVAGLLLCAAMVPLALRGISVRSEEERALSMETRGQFERAASMMLEEHPLGVGAGHYAAELLLGGYGPRAGIWWGSWTAIVHNIYRLTAAEMGYAGVLALVLLFLAPLRTALRYSTLRGLGREGDVLLGLSVGLLTLYIHSFFEWVWRLTDVTHLYFMVCGMIAVLARQIQLRRSRRPSPTTAEAAPGARRPRTPTPPAAAPREIAS